MRKRESEITGCAVSVENGSLVLWLSFGSRVREFRLSRRLAASLIGRLARSLARWGC